MSTVISVGECMLEFTLNSLDNVSYNLGFGGDTLNTSIYLARLNIDVSYFTALGDDPFSNNMISEWQKEGINTKLVRQIQQEIPGLYIIKNDDNGERNFYFWRSNSPACRLFELENISFYEEVLKKFDYIYFSLITLAICSSAARKRFKQALKTARLSGSKIVIDNNYRKSLWENVEQAKKVYQDFVEIADILLPSFDDEQILMNFDTVNDSINYYKKLGIKEVIVKNSGNDIHALVDGIECKIFTEKLETRKIIDTTAAGDSFAAGYIASRIRGQNIKKAIKNAHLLSSRVICHSGAIIPKCFMPEISV